MEGTIQTKARASFTLDHLEFMRRMAADWRDEAAISDKYANGAAMQEDATVWGQNADGCRRAAAMADTIANQMAEESVSMALAVILATWQEAQSFYTPARLGHSCVVLRSPRFGEYVALCECGNRWTYAADSTDDTRRSIYESHLKFFNKPAAPVL